MFPVLTSPEEFKNVTIRLCKSYKICVRGKFGQGNHMIIVTSSFSEKPAFSNSFRLKSVYVKLYFRDELACTVGLTVEIQLLFQISQV